MSFLVLAALAFLATSVVRLVRRERQLVAELAELGERVHELSSRIDAAEDDVARAATHAEIAENVLLDKGIADEDDLEAVRQRFDPTGSYSPERDGDLH
jgi:outer membrane murein-binding lipoprotein Lpp